MFKKIFDIFPPPKFLDIPYAGISISDDFVHCVKFTKKNDSVLIEKFAERPISPGVVTSGEINKKEEIIEILKALKNDLNLTYVKVSLPEEKAYLFTAKIPLVEKGDVVSAIESKIEENVPVSPEELIYDYKLIDHREKDHLDVVVSTIPNAVIDLYIDVVSGAGLSLLSLEIESQAVARAVVPKKTAGTVLVVNFQKEKFGMYVVSDTIVRFTSTLSFQGEVSSNLDLISQEIKKLYTYWHTLKENVDKDEKVIKQIIVCGGGFNEDVVSYFTSKNEAVVSMGNVWVNSFDINKVVPPISFVDSLRFSSAIGLALPNEVLI